MNQDLTSECSFADLKLDARLVEALNAIDISKATLIQEKAIPLSLIGRDILARAPTGSGKTLAYLLPILHGILHQSFAASQTTAIIVVPTNELSMQLEDTLSQLLTSRSSMRISYANLSKLDCKVMLTCTLQTNPSIVVSTPYKLASNSELINWSEVKYFVIDEADYILPFGYSEDLDSIIPLLPKTKQSFLMSATISENIEKIKSVLLRNPAVLKLEMGDNDGGGGQARSKLEQFTIRLKDDSDKFLLTFAIFKLSLLKGKMIVFVSNTERAYKLRIFLEQFGVKSCCINSNFPLSCRQHIVEQFNKGVYDILIAPEHDNEKVVASVNKVGHESGVSRGVDFKRVDVVINFDFPTSYESYVHRVGRTARAGQSGTAISFIYSEADAIVLDQARAKQEEVGNSIGDYSFDMSVLDGFRYRMSDALCAVTKHVIKQTQLAELKTELRNSEKLKTLLPNRREELLKALRHDQRTAVRQRPHLKHIPEYLTQTCTPTPLPQTQPNALVVKPFKSKRKAFGFAGGSKSKDPLRSRR